MSASGDSRGFKQPFLLELFCSPPSIIPPYRFIASHHFVSLSKPCPHGATNRIANVTYTRLSSMLDKGA
jgi:hypothetical protein